MSVLEHDLHTLYSDHHGWLHGWLRKRLGCTHQAADLAHDTFVRVLAREHSVAIQEPRAWLSTIAHGLVIDHRRRRALERAYLESIAHLPEPLAPSAEDTALIIEALARIDALLQGLKPRARRVLLLSRLDGLSYPQIAKQLGVSLSSVEKDMAVAVRHCYQMRYVV